MITSISKHDATKIIAMYRPLGLFYFYDHEADKFVGIDNGTGNAWVEEFDTLEDCRAWLSGC